MTRNYKKYIYSFVQLIEQLHNNFKSMWKEKNTIAVVEYLKQCQNTAINLGTLIERAEKEGFITVELLEEYCELVYQIYMQVEQEEWVESDVKNLYQQLTKIENSIEHDIKVRKEAVFLPYKASMWDSLESVWKAADEDEDCDAYVIPIPYYNKNSDGSVHEICYEGDQYPDYVPIVSYEEYDFEKRHPDMIFIHNPYDDKNFVTSVHPFFYSKNLKQYTEKLIYIPYFVLSEVSPEDETTLEKISHFCNVPGVLNADTVVVQSEDMREAYIRILTDLTGENTRIYWERKILGLGSPKYDKIADISKDDTDIPEEWEQVIRRIDGSRKKVILYNTSINGLLNQGEKYIEKMESVFHVFQKGQEDVALLWRPHPLIKATIESMRPHLLIEYEKIEKRYQEEKWGIYDDSADLKRAIAVCDAYYGDNSSLVQLCQAAGKPVMIQNVEILED